MSAINYEVRYMLVLLRNVINQEPVQKLRRSVQWEIIRKNAEFQKISSIIYCGMLGLEKDISPECEEQFYQRKKKELLLGAAYKSAEEVLKWQFERHNIHALILSGTEISDMYLLPEMAHIERLEIYVEKKKLPKILFFMREMDYEEIEDRLEDGIIMQRVPGIQIALYDKVPVGNPAVSRYFMDPPKRYLSQNGYKYVHILSQEEEYMYRVGRLVESYITGMLRIREILDFWLFKGRIDEQFRWKEVNEILEKAQFQQFITQIDLLCALWFGEGQKQEYGLALELEDYILSPEREDWGLEKRILPYERMRLDFYKRDRDEEWQVRKKEWMFPPREYMAQFFPILDMFPFLLPLFWLARNVRFMKRTCANHWKMLKIHAQLKIYEIRDRWKKEDEENNDEESNEQKDDNEENSSGERDGKLTEESEDPDNREEAETQME